MSVLCQISDLDSLDPPVSPSDGDDPLSIVGHSGVCVTDFGCPGTSLWPRGLLRPAPAATHCDGLVQGPFVVPLELRSDLHQVQLAARNHDPGHHLLLGAFTLQTEADGY